MKGHVLKYLNFIREAGPTDKIRLYYSDSFRNILKIISSESSIARDIISIENNPSFLDTCSLIDVTSKNDTISFIPIGRILKKYPEIDLNKSLFKYSIHNANEFWTEGGRIEMKIGRYVKKIVHSGVTDSDIEKFVNLYKAAFDSRDNINFEIVTGENIRKWYLYSNYESVTGQLGNSCMRYYECQNYLDIYVKNPDVCQLLILKSPGNKICGRALIWKLSDGGDGFYKGEYYMDRPYTIRDSDRILFLEWANARKIRHFNTIMTSNRKMQVKLGNYNYDSYPYMDTFIAYNPSDKLLCNDEDLWPSKGYYLIQETNGGFVGFDVIWSNWEDEYIQKENAVYCENVDSYVERGNAVYIKKGSCWAALTDDVVWSSYHNEYYMIKDVVFSNSMNTIVDPDDPNIVKMIINSKGDVDLVAKEKTGLYLKIDGNLYSRKTYIKDPFDNNKYHFIDEVVKGVEYKTYIINNILKDLDIKNHPKTNSDKVIDKLKDLLSNMKITDQIEQSIIENEKFIELQKISFLQPIDVFNALKVYVYEVWGIKKTLIKNPAYRAIFMQMAGLSKYINIGLFIVNICSSFDYSLFPSPIYKARLYLDLIS